MKEQPKKIIHPRDGEVWISPAVENIRSSECLCLNCGNLKPGQPDNCPIAQELYEICKREKIAFAMSRCPLWKTELQNLVSTFLSNNPGSEDQLAKELDVSVSTIKRWANDETHPHPSIAKQIVTYLKSKLQAG